MLYYASKLKLNPSATQLDELFYAIEQHNEETDPESNTNKRNRFFNG